MDSTTIGNHTAGAVETTVDANAAALVPVHLQRDRFAPLIHMVTASVPSLSAKKTYRRKLKIFFRWWEINGQQPFSRHLIHTYIEQLRAEGFLNYDIGHSLTSIKKLAREAAYAGFIDAIQLDSIQRIKAPPAHLTRMGIWLNEEQMLRLMKIPDRSTLMGKRDVVLIGLMLYCGLRLAETLSIEFANIRIIDGRPCVFNLVGKGSKERTVPMPRWLFLALQEWVDAAGITGGKLIRGLPGHNNQKPLDKPMNPSSAWTRIRKYGVAIDVPDLSPHDFRRTYGRVARKAGVELDQIQQTYGHSSVITTQRYIGGTLNIEHAPCDVLPVPEGF
jgi:integrase